MLVDMLMTVLRGLHTRTSAAATAESLPTFTLSASLKFYFYVLFYISAMGSMYLTVGHGFLTLGLQNMHRISR